MSLDRCDRYDLLVGMEGFHLMSVARTPDALVLVVESCNQLVGCPGCGLNRSRPRSHGDGGDRRALGRGPGADPMAQTTLDMPRTRLPDGDIPGTWRAGVRTPGASGCAGDPVGDPTVVLGGSHHCRIGSTTGNHVEYRVVPYQAVPARPHLNPARFAGVRVLGVDERRVAPPSPTPHRSTPNTGSSELSVGGGI